MTGKLRGGGGEMGLGEEMYWENANMMEVRLEYPHAVEELDINTGAGVRGWTCTHTMNLWPKRERKLKKGFILQAQADQQFDEERRGFTMSFSDNVDGDTGRILAAECIIKVRDCKQ